MDYELTDLIDIEELKLLTENWTDLIHLPMGIFDPYGNALVGSGWKSICTDFHRVHPETLARCRKTDQEMFNLLKEGNAFTYFKCPNGLVDTGSAIVVEGKYLGGLGFGQFFLEPPDLDFFSRQADRFNFDRETYLAAVADVPILTLSHVKQVSKIWVRLAGMIAETGLARLRQQELNTELERHRDQLQDLVAEKTADLMKAKERAEASNIAKSRFLANMSHELRTPLNAILGYGQILARDSELSESTQTKLKTINRSGTHLLRMIDEILELSKVESGRMPVNKECIDLYELLEAVVSMVKKRAENKGLELSCQAGENIPTTILSDKNMLYQVLTNLLNNAVKYTEKGNIGLTADLISDTGRLVFEVSDTGIGISPEHFTSIFEPFTQHTDNPRSMDGVGLGLALVKQHVDMLEGDISVTSEPGKGSVFRVALHHEPGVNTDAEEKSQDCPVVGLAEGQPEYRVLIVDDDPDSCLMLQELLEKTGFSVRTARNGQKAVKIHGEWPPHLIWMDIRMPVMNGIDATRCIRKNEAGNTEGQDRFRSVIIALTASVFDDSREEVMAAGFDDFMRKPVELEILFQCISRHLNVDFIYQTRSESKTGAVTDADAIPLPRDALQGLKPEWIANLRQAVDSGRRQEIARLAADIRQSHGILACALMKRVNDFCIEEIPPLLQNLSTGE